MNAAAASNEHETIAHPSPERSEVGLYILLFGLFAGPLIWPVHMMVNSAYAGAACMGETSYGTAIAVMAISGVASLAVIFLAGLVSYKNWRETHTERRGSGRAAVEIGEGRTRFLSLVGLYFSAGFFVASLFDLLALVMVPLCAS